MISRLRSQRDNDGGGVGQRDLSGDGRPATQRETLQMKEQKDAAKEAFNGTAAGPIPPWSKSEAGRSGSAGGCRFQGTTAVAWMVAWIQPMRRSPQ